MRLPAAAVVLTVVAIFDASKGATTDDGSLADQVQSLKSEVAELRDAVATLKASISSDRNVHMDVGSDGAMAGRGRRLQSQGSTQVSMDGIIHEFPSGHGCSNINGYMRVLPEISTGLSFAPSPSSDLTGNLSLASVNNDWSTNVIATFPAPIKLVHEASCAGKPTIELQLDVSVAQSLTVAGIEVGAKLTALSGSWTDIPIVDPSAWSYRGERTQYLVRDGLVFLRGGIGTASGSLINAGDGLARLPQGARPLQLTVVPAATMSSEHVLRVHIASDGWITVEGPGGTTDNVHFDGVVYAV